MNSQSDDESHVNGNGKHLPRNGERPESRALMPSGAPRGEIALIPTGLGPTSKPSAVDQQAVIAAIRRRWFAALSLGLIGSLTVAGGIWFLVPVSYTAFSELRIHVVAPYVLPDKSDSSRGTFEIYKQTQMKQVKSPFVMERVVNDKKVKDASFLQDETHPIEYLQREVLVTSPAIEFIRISLSGQNPKELADVVNSITDEYLDEVKTKEHDLKTNRIKELDKTYATLKDDMRLKQSQIRRLADLLHTGDVAALSEKQKYMIELYAQYRRNLAQNKFDLIRARVQLAAKEGAAGTEDGEPAIDDAIIDAHVAHEPAIRRLTDDVARKNNMVLEADKAYKNKENDRFKRAKSDYDAALVNLELMKSKLRPNVEERLRAELKQKTAVTVGQLREQINLREAENSRLEAEIVEFKDEVKKTGIMSLDLESLREDLRQKDTIARKISDELERLKIELANDPRVSKYQPAETPHRPDVEKQVRIVGAAGFGTFLLIAGAIVCVDLRLRRINTLEEVATGLRLPILGSLPAVPRRATLARSRRGGTDAPVWQGTLMESVDSARVMLLRKAHLENAKVAMIVSAMGSEGKTTLSCHLATSLARAGYRTLLVDSDIRRPTIHRVFEIPAEPGLCEVLRQELDVAEAIVPTSQEGLFALPAGTISPETLRELAQDGLGPIVNLLREEYDFVILDSSPILPVTDSLLISQYVDGVIFSIRRDVSQYPKVATACQRLAMMGIPLWGAVVIGLDQLTYGYRYAYAYATSQK